MEKTSRDTIQHKIRGKGVGPPLLKHAPAALKKNSLYRLLLMFDTGGETHEQIFERYTRRVTDIRDWFA